MVGGVGRTAAARRARARRRSAHLCESRLSLVYSSFLSVDCNPAPTSHCCSGKLWSLQSSNRRRPAAALSRPLGLFLGCLGPERYEGAPPGDAGASGEPGRGRAPGCVLGARPGRLVAQGRPGSVPQQCSERPGAGSCWQHNAPPQPPTARSKTSPPSPAAGDWVEGTAVPFGGPTDGADPHVASGGLKDGSCGYGEMEPADWPHWSVVAVSPTSALAANATRRPLLGCGACLELRCDPRPGYEVRPRGVRMGSWVDVWALLGSHPPTNRCPAPRPRTRQGRCPPNSESSSVVTLVADTCKDCAPNKARRAFLVTRLKHAQTCRCRPLPAPPAALSPSCPPAHPPTP